MDAGAHDRGHPGDPPPGQLGYQLHLHRYLSTVSERWHTEVGTSKSPERVDAYPIAGFTYLLVYEDLDYIDEPEASEALLEFLDWALTDGQAGRDSGVLYRANEVTVEFRFADTEEAVRAHLSAGPARRAIETAGVEAVSSAIASSLESSIRPDGSSLQQNSFRYLVAAA